MLAVIIILVFVLVLFDIPSKFMAENYEKHLELIQYHPIIWNMSEKDINSSVRKEVF